MGLTHIKDLTPDPQNARKHSPRNVGTITDALREVGAARSIVIDEDGVILAGNATAEAAAEAGFTKVQIVDADGQTIIAVRRSGLTPNQKSRLALFDNRAAELADGWDVDVLKALQEDGVDLSNLWHDDELAELLGTEPKGGLTDPDDVPAERATDIKLGDLFELGAHRLLAGDSTKAEDVARAMGGLKGDVLFTDPPYNVDYEGNYIQSGQILKKAEKVWSGGIANDNKGDNFAGWLALAFAEIDSMLNEGAAIYVWHPSGAEGRHFWAAWLWDRWHFQVDLIWNKTSLIISRWDYKPQHEPCMYGWKGKNRKWIGPNNDATVWDIPRQQGASGETREHPTQKPVALALSAIKNHPGLVVDPFLGSGSTLIAAEQLGRECYGLELSSSYCQVIIDRWEQFTGQKAQKVGEALHA